MTAVYRVMYDALCMDNGLTPRGTQARRMIDILARPFHHQGQLYRPLVALYVLINLVVLRNAVFHDPYIGYDTSAYLEYIQAFADGSLPSSVETGEFFSPPLAFVPGTLFYAALQPHADSPALNPPNEEARISSSLYYRFLYSIDDFPLALAAKLTQLLNVVYSLGATYLLVKIAWRLRPELPSYRLLALFLFGMLPVFYKTFAFVRAEPLMLLIVLLAFDRLFQVLARDQPTLQDALALGVLAGLGMLTRQWFAPTVALLFIGLGLAAYRQAQPSRQIARLLIGFGLVSLAICMPFYLQLQIQEGAIGPPRDAGPEEIFADPELYIAPLNSELFTDPVRASFGYQFMPILYSETWGDYWAYFQVWGRDKQSGRYIYGLFMADDIVRAEQAAAGQLSFETNRFTVNEYLGRVNAASLIPSFVLLVGLALGLRQRNAVWTQGTRDQARTARSVFALYILLSLAVYLTYLLFYLVHDPSSAKATYILHIFPFLALLGTEALQRLRDRHPPAYWALIALLVLVALHNLPALFSRQVL